MKVQIPFCASTGKAALEIEIPDDTDRGPRSHRQGEGAGMNDRQRKLEQDIDAVGRDRVFLRALSHGWLPQDAPPLWVWEEIVAKLRAEEPIQ